MPKTTKPIKLVITKDCKANIAAKIHGWRSDKIERVETRMDRFQLLLQNPKGNLTELEKMRREAGQRLREKILTLGESDDFMMMANTREAHRDAGDYALCVFPPGDDKDDPISNYEFAVYLKRKEGERGTFRISTDGIGNAYSTVLEEEGPDDLGGNYEDLL